MADPRSDTTTTADLVKGIDDKAVKRAISEIFPKIHPRLPEENTLLTEIFRPETAAEYLKALTDISELLTDNDNYEQTLEKIQAQIDAAVATKNQVLAELYEKLRPIERSYRQLWLFFENAVVPDGQQRMPVELFVYDADAAAMTSRGSTTLGALREFVASRNDDFNFRNDICNLVIPGDLNMEVRQALEEEAYKWGMLMITDLGDAERTYQRVVDQFRPDGRHQFLKRPDSKAASDVVIVGYLKLRPAHSFEGKLDGGDGLYAPASVAFAAAMARTDRTRDSVIQGPVGQRFGQIKGVEKARIECRISQMELLSQDMQVIPIVRDADNGLCFYGCRSLADDKYGVLKFFGSYRILMYLERSINTRFRDIANQVLTRTLLDDEVEKPIQKLLDEQMELGSIMSYKLFVDKDPNLRVQGICSVHVEVMPTGPGEVFNLTLHVPEFKKTKPGPEGGSGTS